MPLVLVVPSPQIYINEMRKSSNVTGWKCPLAKLVNNMLLRGLECKCENITSESRGDVTCDSLGDVTWSHGTHDVKRSVGKVRRIWIRKQHQEDQNRIVMSTREFLLLWFRINRNQSSDRSSSTQASRMPARACVRKGACWSPSSR